MPSKKRKYNARFPAGRIKKIMQTDEEVGKVAQAVPIIISRTLELFVESLLQKALRVTVARNAKTLSPSHVKQCILAESRFDFLRDLVKNIPDVSAAEEKELLSAESSPNSSRHAEPPAALAPPAETDTHKLRIPETVTSTIVSADAAIDLSKKKEDDKPRLANFYQETLTESVQHKSVIQVNPTYNSPQPSTSGGSQEAQDTVPKQNPLFYLDVRQTNNVAHPTPPRTPVTPILNIDFTKNLSNPEIKVLDTAVANIVGVKNENRQPKLQRQSSKVSKELKRDRPAQSPPVDFDSLQGNLQIDEDYDT